MLRDTAPASTPAVPPDADGEAALAEARGLLRDHRLAEVLERGRQEADLLERGMAPGRVAAASVACRSQRPWP